MSSSFLEYLRSRWTRGRTMRGESWHKKQDWPSLKTDFHFSNCFVVVKYTRLLIRDIKTTTTITPDKTGFSVSRGGQFKLCSHGDSELLILLPLPLKSCGHALPCPHPVYVTLGIEPRTSCVLGSIPLAQIYPAWDHFQAANSTVMIIFQRQGF